MVSVRLLGLGPGLQFLEQDQQVSLNQFLVRFRLGHHLLLGIVFGIGMNAWMTSLSSWGRSRTSLEPRKRPRSFSAPQIRCRAVPRQSERYSLMDKVLQSQRQLGLASFCRETQISA